MLDTHKSVKSVEQEAYTCKDFNHKVDAMLCKFWLSSIILYLSFKILEKFI